MTLLCDISKYSQEQLNLSITKKISDIVMSLYDKFEKKLLKYGFDIMCFYYTVAVITLFYFIVNHLHNIYTFVFKTVPRKIINLFKGKIELDPFDCKSENSTILSLSVNKHKKGSKHSDSDSDSHKSECK